MVRLKGSGSDYKLPESHPSAKAIGKILRFGDSALSQKRSKRGCPGCIGPADPEVILRGPALDGESIGSKEAPGKHPSKSSKHLSNELSNKSLDTQKEPDTWFNLLFGGEYWYGWKGGEWWNAKDEVTPKLFDTLRHVRPTVLHASIWGAELLTGIHSGGELVGFTPISPKGIDTVRDYLDWWRKFNVEAHGLGIKVQATFSMTLIWDNQERNKGWFKYYNDFWEEKTLGPKPVRNPLEFLQRDRLGRPLSAPDTRWQQDFYSYKGCPNSPYWRQLLKQLVKAGISAGFDGFMVQTLMRDDCFCRYCQEGFRGFLKAKYSERLLRDRFGIENVATAFLETTRGQGQSVALSKDGMDQSKPLALEARQFTEESLKSAFDEIFVQYGRSLKPDLMLSAWTHHRGFLSRGADYRSFETITDERGLLSPGLWGRGENYLWYCLGETRSRLSEHVTGDASLSAKFIYNMGEGKPFVVMKYDYDRPRLSLAESWAHRGIGLALRQEEFRDILAPYYSFIHRYRDRYVPSEPYAELALVLPRRGFYENDASFLPDFESFGRSLLDDHVLFDVIVDQHLSRTDLTRYQMILLPTANYLSPFERKQLQSYREAGGTLVLPAKSQKEEVKDLHSLPRFMMAPKTDNPAVMAAFVRRAMGPTLSSCDAPWTLQMTVWHQPKLHRLIVHLVNYDRDEGTPGQENPRLSGPIHVNLNLPSGARVLDIEFATPEEPEPKILTVSLKPGQVQFTTPGLLVYGVATVKYVL